MKGSILPFRMYNIFIVCFAASASVSANLYFLFIPSLLHCLYFLMRIHKSHVQGVRLKCRGVYSSVNAMDGVEKLAFLFLSPSLLFRERVLHNPSPSFSFNFISTFRLPHSTFSRFTRLRSLFFICYCTNRGISYSRAHHASYVRHTYAIFHFK